MTRDINVSDLARQLSSQSGRGEANRADEDGEGEKLSTPGSLRVWQYARAMVFTLKGCGGPARSSSMSR